VSDDLYREQLMAEGARTMERLRLERDEWKRKYEELLHERSSEAVSGTTSSGDRA
jgi:hypothetical protein